jgi:hypothetical protein
LARNAGRQEQGEARNDHDRDTRKRKKHWRIH